MRFEFAVQSARWENSVSPTVGEKFFICDQLGQVTPSWFDTPKSGWLGWNPGVGTRHRLNIKTVFPGLGISL